MRSFGFGSWLPTKGIVYILPTMCPLQSPVYAERMSLSTSVDGSHSRAGLRFGTPKGSSDDIWISESNPYSFGHCFFVKIAKK